ncbi:IS21 family transposase [Mycobacterium numidiamassiliense]|nr:IS21 family transposase [Mycobacterium numidiamassiliense]
MMSVEDWAEIRRLHRSEGMPIKAIARVMGVGRNTVRRALAAEGPPKYERLPRGSKVDAVEPQIRELLRAYPRMPATVIAERVGWGYGITILKDRIRELRPLYLPPDPSGRTQYVAGELAQCDLWFPPVDIPLGCGQFGRPPVLVMVSGYSRVITAKMLPSRQSPDLLCGHWELLCGWGVVPRALVWDNESAVGKWRGGKPELTSAMNAFRGVLGIKVVLCRPADPEAKGLVERANGYLETSFLPGRSFDSPADFNDRLTTWLVGANSRTHRRLGCRPADRWDADAAAMLELPPTAPAVGWATTVRLGRDHYVRLGTNDYSVHPSVIGRKVSVSADLNMVWVQCDSVLVAVHRRCWAAHQTISDPAHIEAAAQLRTRHRLTASAPADDAVAYRDLSDYDRILGLGEEAAS